MLMDMPHVETSKVSYLSGSVNVHVCRCTVHYANRGMLLWAKSSYSLFYQSSGPVRGLIVCRGIQGTLWHWVIVGTFSMKMPH